MGDLSGSDRDSSKGLGLLLHVYTVHSDVPISMVTLVGLFSFVTVHSPVHRWDLASFQQLGYDSSTCCPMDNCLPSEPPHTCSLLLQLPYTYKFSRDLNFKVFAVNWLLQNFHPKNFIGKIFVCINWRQ